MSQRGHTDKFTPVDVAAERAVAAALLVDASAFDEVIESVSPDDFADPLAKAVVLAALACDASGRPVDQITVADEMKRQKTLSKVGGIEALDGLVESAASATDHVDAHGRIVAEKSKLRQVIHAGREMAAAAMQPDAQWRDVRETAEKLVFELGNERQSGTLVGMSQAVPKAMAELAKSRTQLLLGHSTGFPELDRLTAGFQPGQLIVVAARPAMGKSAFALHLARHVAETSGLTVPFLSYEMSSIELTTRLLAGVVGFDLMKLRAGVMPEGFDRELALAGERVVQLPLLIDDNPPPTIAGMRSAMRRVARRGQLGMIVVDYLQLMEGDRRSRDASRTEEVSEITRGLKRLASELGVPIVALSQLNRGLESRPNKRPQLSDLRESGSIEQDANTVLFLYRDYVYNTAADPTAAEVLIAKQRSGPAGMAVPVIFDGPAACFRPSQEKASPIGSGSSKLLGPGPSGNGNGFSGGYSSSNRPF